MNEQEMTILKEEARLYYEERKDDTLWCGGCFPSEKFIDIQVHVDKQGNLQKVAREKDGVVDYFKPAKE